MSNITLLEHEIKKLQQEKSEILKLERMNNKKLEMQKEIQKMCILKLNGMTKENAVNLVVKRTTELCNACGEAKAREVFGYRNNCFLPTSLTIDDIKNDEFLIDLIIMNVGIELFIKSESIKGRKDEQAKNIMKRLYEKLSCKKIVRYLIENYPLK